MTVGEECERLRPQHRREAVTERDFPLRLGQDRFGGGEERRQSGLERGAAGARRRAVAAMFEAVAVARLGAALSASSGLRRLNRFRLASYGHLPLLSLHDEGGGAVYSNHAIFPTPSLPGAGVSPTCAVQVLHPPMIRRSGRARKMRDRHG